jgi:hypothetical protein
VITFMTPLDFYVFLGVVTLLSWAEGELARRRRRA